MAYIKQQWSNYNEKLTESQNKEKGAVATSDRLNHMEQGISDAHTEIAFIGENYRPNLDKSVRVKVISFPLEADLIDNGARIQFRNITISCMGPSGQFELEIPNGTIDYAHGQNICIDTSSRATEIIFVQPSWPTIEDTTKWAIGSMTTNALVVDGKQIYRRTVEIYGAGTLSRDYVQ